ncbi:hypothetical protein [Pseudomonas sp. KNUC1026]|uniref:hypothetical protein n=1 Tax=Pseudomonas sp. KNUC1026 TaxID=2893890 RepID=UPI001F2C08B0|nr:hypothetical protein [Pseudomonas sp. KNUC1026]UFH48324.1 hypothetical protein LN139_14295 [Pseudomonas sp. KNUC1026]
MHRRTLLLLVLLAIASVTYLATQVDWSIPRTLYVMYQEMRHYQELAREDDGEMLKRLKARFGENAGMVYSTAIDGDGQSVRTLQVTRQCDDNGQFDSMGTLKEQVRFLHEQGLQWPDKVQYLWSCNFQMPETLGVGPARLNTLLDKRLAANPGCAAIDARAGSYSQGRPFGTRQVMAEEGALELRLVEGSTGDADKALLQAWPSLTSEGARAQKALMRCTLEALLAALAPDAESKTALDALEKYWADKGKHGGFQRVGGLQLEATHDPVAVQVYPRPATQ